MIIESIYSGGSRKLYSVLLDSEEIRVFSKIQRTYSSFREKKNKLHNIQWKRGSQISDETITEAELAYGIKLPQDVKEVFKFNNNARPFPSTFDSTKSKGHEVKKLLSFKKEDPENIYSVKRLLSTVDKSLFPLAVDSAGNLICIKNNKIVFWLHETNKIIPLANNFTDFLSKLYFNVFTKDMKIFSKIQDEDYVEENISAQKRAKYGNPLAGAAVGALIGNGLTGSKKGALVGGVVGGGIGYHFGKKAAKKHKRELERYLNASEKDKQYLRDKEARLQQLAAIESAGISAGILSR